MPYDLFAKTVTKNNILLNFIHSSLQTVTKNMDMGGEDGTPLTGTTNICTHLYAHLVVITYTRKVFGICVYKSFSRSRAHND